MGGIGKTELCKNYFIKYSDNFKHIGWIDYVGDIKESFVNQITNNALTFKNDETIDERYYKIIDFLNNLDSNSLLIIDNIENDQCLNVVRRFPFKVLISSRINFKGFKQFPLDFLSMDNCKKLFYEHYNGNHDDNTLEKIIELAGKHTLTIELLANTAQNAALSIRVLYEKLQEHKFNLKDTVKEKITTLWDSEKDKKTLFDHLLKVFSIGNISEEEKYILMNLSILPSMDIKKNNLKYWLQLESNDDINSLVKKGWLNETDFNIKVHQLIQETIRYELKPNSHKCKTLIESITKKLNFELGENPLDKKEYTIYGDSILKNIYEEKESMATLCNNLSNIYKCTGHINKAFDLQVKAVKTCEKVLNENHPFLAFSYGNLAMIYKSLGKPYNALELKYKAIKIIINVYGENHASLATTYNNLSNIYQDLGELENSLKFQLKAIEIHKKVSVENQPFLATSYNNLSLIYKKLGKLENALEFQYKAIEIYIRVWDKNHPELATLYNNLSTIYQGLRQLDNALEFQLKAVAIDEKLLHESHPDLAVSYNNLSSIYQDLGQLNNALEFQLKAIKIYEKVVDENNPNLGILYNNLFSIYQDLEQLDKIL